MIVQTRENKDLVIPKSLGNFVTEGSGGGITPEEATEIAAAVTQEAIDEYDTELQVELEEIRDAISGISTDTLLNLSEIVSMTVAERVALFDEVYEKAAAGEKVYIKGLVQEETVRTAVLPLVSYRPETNPVLHQGGSLYFAAKGDTDNVYFHIALSSEGTVDPTSGNIIKRNIYNLPTASATVKGGVKIGSGLVMTEDTVSVDTTGLVTDGDLAPFIVQLSAATENIGVLSGATEQAVSSLTSDIETLSAVTSGLSTDLNALSGATEAMQNSLSNYATTATTEALSTAIGNKQDTLSAGNGIAISNNTVSVKAGEGLAFSGDTLVVSGGSDQTVFVIYDVYAQNQELADFLFQYVDLQNESVTVSSGYPMDSTHIYLWLGQDFQGAFGVTDFGFVELFPSKVYYDGNPSFILTGVYSDQELEAYSIRVGYNQDGYTIGNWSERIRQNVPVISFVRFGNDDRGNLTYDADNGYFIYDNGTFNSGDVTTTYPDLIDKLFTDYLFDGGLVFDYIYPVNTNKFYVIKNGETIEYAHPKLSRKEISDTIDGVSFTKEATYDYGDYKLTAYYGGNDGNITANVRITVV